MNMMHPDPRNKQSGFGLVEIMVALVIGLFLMAGVSQIYISNKESYRLAEDLSRRQENARFAMKNLSRALEPGGYQGCLGAPGTNFVNTLAITGGYDFGVAVTGTDAPDTVTLTRANGGSAIGVTVEMASKSAPIQLDDTDPDYQKLKQYQVLMISDCEASATFMITNDPENSNGTIEHQEGDTFKAPGPLNKDQYNLDSDLRHIFGSETSSVATVYATDSVTLSVRPHAGGSWLLANGDPLIEGVRDLQITYAVPTAAGNMRFVDASAVADWTAVQSMQVTLALVERADCTDDEGPVGECVRRTFRIRNINPS